MSLSILIQRDKSIFDLAVGIMSAYILLIQQRYDPENKKKKE
jgi:hypothetical protein